MTPRFLQFALTAFLSVLAAMPLAWAAPSDEEMRAIGQARAEYERAKRAIDRLAWKEAITALEGALRHDPRDAELHNLLGFSYRASGKMDEAFRHYFRALELNPRHRGAHEYIGRAYLMTDKPDKAVEHLEILEKQCPELCKERDLLRKAIDDYPWPPPGRVSRGY